MKPFKNDIAVAMIFFNRPDCFEKVFNAVAAQRPSRLYLIQDGPRANRPKDRDNIDKCRDLIKNIDWDCQVTKMFSDTNLGCGKRIFSGLTEVFKKEEFAVIIEDDIVIGDSFLPFCKQMDERYRNDERIGQISGMNHLGVYEDCPYDYFFASCGGAIWGWATWRRVWETLDWELNVMSSPYYQRCLNNANLPDGRGREFCKRALAMRNKVLGGGAPTIWSLHFSLYRALSNVINIVPKYNLTSNIGLSEETTHGTSSINKVVKRGQVLFFGKIYDMPSQLKHPEYFMDDQYYMKQQDKIVRPSKIVKLLTLPERVYRKFFVK